MKFFQGNEWYWRLLRTIAQGVIGVLVANIDVIVSWFNISPSVKPLIAALCMAVLSPVMAEIGKGAVDRADNTNYTFSTNERGEK